MPSTAHRLNVNKVRSIFFFGLIGILSLLFLYVLQPIFYPIFWAAIIAIVFYPLYARLNALMKLPNLSSLTTIAIAAVAIFVPLSIIGLLLFNESMQLYNHFSKAEIISGVSNFANRLQGTVLSPYIASLRLQWSSSAADATKFIALFFANNIARITQNSLHILFLLFIIAYSLFYFFRDGVKILKRLQHLSPLEDSHDILLYRRFTSTLRATLKSMLVLGGVQGVLSGLLFWLVGIDGALSLGLLFFILSAIPGLGTLVVWLPTGIILLVLGNLWPGIIVLTGAAIIGLSDNLLRPRLVGKAIELHPVLVLFSTLGGIFIFGVPGLII